MTFVLRLLSAIFVTLLLSAPAMAADRLVLSSGMHEPWTNAEGTGFTNLFVAELFARLGLKAEVSFNPAAARALQLADAGTDDGLAARIAGLEKDYPNLVRVPEPIFINDFIAASTGVAPAVRNWDDLRPHVVAYILGWQVFDNNLPPVRDLTHAKDSRQLLGMLKSGRAEYILHERWQAEWQARVQGVALTVQEPPLVSTPMYIYLHRRHADLVPRVAAELAAMKAEGHDKALMAKVMARAGSRPQK
ncbi:MAG: substrate-binding periplasmic protein [Bacteroidales bacterium]